MSTFSVNLKYLSIVSPGLSPLNLRLSTTLLSSKSVRAGLPKWLIEIKDENTFGHPHKVYSDIIAHLSYR